MSVDHRAPQRTIPTPEATSVPRLRSDWDDDGTGRLAYRYTARYIYDLVLAANPDGIEQELASAAIDRGELLSATSAVLSRVLQALHETHAKCDRLDEENRRLRNEARSNRRPAA